MEVHGRIRAEFNRGQAWRSQAEPGS